MSAEVTVVPVAVDADWDVEIHLSYTRKAVSLRTSHSTPEPRNITPVKPFAWRAAQE